MDKANSILDDMENYPVYSGTITWGDHKCGVLELPPSVLLAEFSNQRLLSIMEENVALEEYERACICRDELIRRGALNPIKESNG